MRFAYRFGPLAAIGAALAVLVGLIGASGAGSNADSFAVDLDTAGNTATALGAIDECREVNAGGTVTIDVVATNVPSGAAAMIAFHFAIGYNAAALSVTAKDLAGLLSTAAGYTELDVGDTIPDADGSYVADVADLGAAGVSGSGYLQRLTIAVAPGAAAGGYALSIGGDPWHTDTVNEPRTPDATFGARLAVGVTCDSLPSPTAAPSNVQGDVDCSKGANPVNSVDALKVLRHVANLSVVQNEPCDDINTGGPPVQGDVDCSAGANAVSAVDALKILRFVANLSVVQNEPCDNIGT